MRRYEFIPAAIDSLSRSLCIGVRFKSKPTDVRKLQATRKLNDAAYAIDLEDRQVFFIKATGKLEGFAARDFDLMLNVDYFREKTLIGELGYKIAMVNSAAVPQKYHRDYAYESEKFGWPDIISDSGGFQLSTGVESFIDPVELVETHNKVCSLGIALDIPFPVLSETDIPLFLKTAKVQRANTRVFQKHKLKSLQLVNVFHGNTLYLLDKYREVVEDEGIDRVCLGGIVKADLMTIALRLVHVMTSGQKYKQYHALGVSGLERWVMLCYLAQRKIVPLITSDSSAYIQAGINTQVYDPGRLCYNRDFRGRTQLAIEKVSRLACSCPACSTMTSASCITDTNNKVGTSVSVIHNLFVVRNYVDSIYEATEPNVSRKELMGFLSQTVVSTEKLKMLSHVLDAIDMALEDGVHTACKKYAEALLHKTAETSSSAGLFGRAVSQSAQRKEHVKRIEGIVDRYHKYHTTGKRG